ncbi:hypothetical protein [Mucilaginibacter paludis]|uniref:Uncharacterized protein n=1 Tax=Mucilaginibacter paludis DSM 18603 TaxID=714943 RepID=H1YCD8_9SPHI|nr:hypothetical protein [Mucilaginibacter paludis]EHQ30129.1 hypothetical protein Mucpa_6071 [Mucilaginibacter paludis DSM 18603]
MVQFKVLLVLIVIIINLNPSHKVELSRSYQCKNGSMVFYNNIDTVNLKEVQYKIDLNEKGFNLTILDKSQLDHVAKMDSPEIFFCIDGKKNLAKGLDLFSSFLPAKADYFFGLNKNKTVVLITSNVLQLWKVKP